MPEPKIDIVPELQLIISNIVACVNSAGIESPRRIGQLVACRVFATKLIDVINTEVK